MSEARLHEALRRDRIRQIQNLPFTVIRKDGLVHIDAKVDAAFRKALMDGIPAVHRGKMREALAAIPDRSAYAHSVRYFGTELPAIRDKIAPLLIELNRYLSMTRGLEGLFDWLQVTGFSNDYRMIKAFSAWADMKVTR